MTVSLPVECKATYKILVLGDSNVGKTCIVHRYCDDAYYDTYISTIGKLKFFLKLFISCSTFGEILFQIHLITNFYTKMKTFLKL